jgi:FKBP-type peptidyl-prolyl cis-trans isomerase
MNMNPISTRLPAALATVATAALIAGCGSSGGSSSIGVGKESASVPAAPAETTPAATATTAATPTSGPLSTEPKIARQTGPAPKELVEKEIVKGSGPEAKVGDSVTVNYVGALYSNNKVFDASWLHHEPSTFPLNPGGLIAGWVKGVPGMRVGGRRELIIPAELAYGKPGRPPTIPPNSPLVFIIDLLSV